MQKTSLFLQGVFFDMSATKPPWQESHRICIKINSNTCSSTTKGSSTQEQNTQYSQQLFFLFSLLGPEHSKQHTCIIMGHTLHDAGASYPKNIIDNA